MASPYIIQVHSQGGIETLLGEKSVVVISFHASWSAPCQKMAPVYSRLASKHRSLTFAKVEIAEDNIQSVAQKCRLVMLPTFIMVKDEKEIGRISGPDQKGLEDMIAKHAPEAELAAKDTGLDAIAAGGQESLLEFLDMQKVNCLNEAQDHPLESIVEMRTRNTSEAYLESDADEQLLITLPFIQKVKVRSVILHTKDSKFGPKKIKIDINKLALGFDDVESATEPAVIQVLEVPEEVVKEAKPIHLRFVRLQQVDSLHIFVESNHGTEDVTRIDAIDVYGPGGGEPVSTSQITGLRDFYGIHERGMELFELFQRQGGDENLSSAVALLRESALLCPAGHGQRTVPVGNLASALLFQYEYRGDYADLNEAITLYHETLELEPPGHPGRAASLNNLASCLFSRYEREGSLSDLEEMIEMHREALNHRPPGHPDRASSLNNLANGLSTRYKRKGSLSDLEETIEKHREALDLYALGHPDRAKSLNNLADALGARYRHGGSLSDLEEAIEKHRKALNLRPLGHPDRASSLNNLADALSTRYERQGSLADLQEMIEKHREALDLFPPGHPSCAASLNNLANALITRYEREGSLSDLDETIEKHREALDIFPPDHPYRARSSNNLADALSTRYEREGSLADLEEAIEMNRGALNLFSSGHPDRPTSLNNLASTLFTRFRHEGSLSVLEETIEKHREAFDLLPPGHPQRAKSLNNIANVLFVRFKREGSLSDLEETIDKYREALNLCPPGHPHRAASLNNLANALSTRYERGGSQTDIEEATAHLENALELRPHGHPDRSMSLLSLSREYLLAIGRVEGASAMHDNGALVANIFTMLREAVFHTNSPPFHRLQAALKRVDACISLAPGLVLEAYGDAFDQLDIVLATSNTLASKHTRLSSKELTRCKQLGVEAASCAVRRGDMILAVEFLERGRNLLFTQIGRYRVELEELHKEHAELAKRFSDLSGLLDSSVMSNQSILEGRTAFEDPAAWYRRVASDWDRVVTDIRAVPGFESFLRPPHYTTLQAAAAEGPVVIVIPDADQSHALIMLRGRDTPHYVNLPKAGEAELVTLCDEFIQAVQSEDEEDADGRITALLRSLWVDVVGPIAAALEDELRCPLHSRIWWCPSSYMSILPLHAAGRYNSNNPNRNLPAKYVSSYTSTVQALLRTQSKHSIRKGERMLIVAQPDTPGQGRLPNTIPEAEIVGTLAAARFKMKPTVLSSKEGTRAAVLNAIVEHSWIHLTCHGSQNFANPFDSCFCLYDKELTLHDIMQRGLPDAKFAFLAACHTSTGDITLLDEGLHLAAGLQFAGFQSVVGTIWEVADIDGPVIAEAFYMALQPEGAGEEGVDCRGAALALSKAVKYLRDQGAPISRWIRHIHIGI